MLLLDPNILGFGAKPQGPRALQRLAQNLIQSDLCKIATLFELWAARAANADCRFCAKCCRLGDDAGVF